MVQKETNSIQVPLRQHLHTYMRYLSLQKKKADDYTLVFAERISTQSCMYIRIKKEFVIS